MSQNPFHPDNLDPIGKAVTHIKKGGPGSGRHAGEEASLIADKIRAAIADGALQPDETHATPVYADHVAAAAAHAQRAKEFLDQAALAATSGLSNYSRRDRDKLWKAAQAHLEAARAHDEAADANLDTGGAYDDDYEFSPWAAKYASQDAVNATSSADYEDREAQY